MTKSEQLSMHFEGNTGKRKKIDIAEELRTAAFVKEENGTWYATFSKESITKLMDSIGDGSSKIYLKTKLKHHSVDGRHQRYHVYLNEGEVDMLLEDIEHYNETGDWRQVK